MTYYADYRLPGGGRKSYRIGPAANLTVGQARTIARQVLGDVATGRDPQAAKVEARREAKTVALSTLGGFLAEKYGHWVKIERKTGAATLAQLQSCFSAWMEIPMKDITPWMVERWRADRKKAGTLPATINRDVVALKAALSKAVGWGLLDSHPLAGLKPAKTDNAGKVRYLDPDEEGNLRHALRERDARMKAERRNANQWRRERGYSLYPDLDRCAYADHLEPLVLLAMNTGMRRGELFNLQWIDVALDRSMLTIRGEGAKSGKTRHIPLNGEALEALRGWKAQGEGSGFVFPGRDGDRLSNINTSWQAILEAAGIVGFRFHDLRHHFASRLVMAGVDLNTVRELLGHSDIKMTLRYAHLAPEHKAAAVCLLDRPNNVTPLSEAREA